MQLSARLAPVEEDEAWFAASAPVEPPPTEAVREADARRCVVCRSRFPTFGYGPPLTSRTQVVWACAAHRLDVERRLASQQTPEHPA